MSTRMIFVLSPGRTGTGYLAKMMETVPGVSAHHEPEPNFARASQAAQHNKDKAIQFWVEHKLPAIAECGEPVYFETSHQFVHFAEALMDLEIPADVVVLTRSHRDAALSHWRRGAIPGRSAVGRTYLCDPAGPNVELPLPDWESFEDYQLVYWHHLEVEARINTLLPKLDKAGSKVYTTSLDSLVSDDGFHLILTHLGLPAPDPELYAVKGGRPVNANPEQMLAVGPGGDLDMLEAEVERALGMEPKAVNDDPRPSVHVFMLNMGEVREELSEWRVAWQTDQRYKVRVQGTRDTPIASNRNRAVQKFLRGDADYLMMIDDDTVPQRNPLDLVQSDLDIVAMPTPMWMPKRAGQWPIYMNIEPLQPLGEPEIGDTYYAANPDPIIEIKSAGTGCVLIARRVLEHPEMRAPFMDEFDEDGIRGPTEDVTFFRRARACGFRAWAAMQYRCSHFKTLDLLLVDMIYRQIFEMQKQGKNKFRRAVAAARNA